MASGDDLDEAGRLEAALRRIAQVAATAAMRVVPAADADDAAAVSDPAIARHHAADVAAVLVRDAQADAVGATELARRLDGLIANLREALSPGAS